MTPETIRWIIGILAFIAVAIASGALGLVLSLVQRVKALETKIEPLWKSVAFNLAVDLKHNPKPSDLRMNELIDKFVNETIERSELAEFADKLRWVQEFSESTKEQIKAKQLLKMLRDRYEMGA